MDIHKGSKGEITTCTSICFIKWHDLHTCIRHQVSYLHDIMACCYIDIFLFNYLHRSFLISMRRQSNVLSGKIKKKWTKREPRITTENFCALPDLVKLEFLLTWPFVTLAAQMRVRVNNIWMVTAGPKVNILLKISLRMLNLCKVLSQFSSKAIQSDQLEQQIRSNWRDTYSIQRFTEPCGIGISYNIAVYLIIEGME